ncbi:hypothetical protein [uncultured Tateyamaria sp.]|uniref:hypothetical protein n=1 Tax=uncultured Tateyamaria sp. TaxID=455651 RepID=UPI00260F2E97|nr:hypothetical protein [uncultured Tateyamaria sp.]
MRWIMLCVCGFGLVACDMVPQWAGGDRPATTVAQPVDDAGSGSETDGDTPLDDDTELEASEPELSTGTLGRTVASLGNAAEPGLWLKTPLVSAEQAGRVYYPDTNRTVDVTLIPIDGPDTAGSRLSLAAMQALGAPLTGLPEVDVFAG